MEKWNKKKSMFESPRTQTTALCELSSSANPSFHRYCCYCHCCMRTEWSPRNRIKKKRDALHLMRTSPRELDWSPMILNGNDRCVMGDNNSVELRWGTPAKMLQLRPGANALASCWLGILLYPVTHWLNRSYSAMFEGRVPGTRTSIHPWSSGILQRRERSAIVLCFQQTAWHGIFPGRYPPLGALGRKRKEK